MELKDVLPILGVGLGWLLKEFSDRLRFRGEMHGKIGRVLVRLIQLDDELRRLDLHQKFIKDRPGSWQEYERFRVGAARRYLHQRGSVQESVQEAIDLVATRWPFDAVDLGHVKVLLTWYYKMDLSALASDREKYIKALSSLEVSVDMAKLLLRRLILKLARMHSLVTWMRVKWNWRKHHGRLARENQEFGERFLTELFDGESQSSTATEQPNATGNKSTST